MKSTTMYLRLRLPTASSEAAAVRLAGEVDAVRNGVDDVITETRVLRAKAASLRAESELQRRKARTIAQRARWERRRSPRSAA